MRRSSQHKPTRRASLASRRLAAIAAAFAGSAYGETLGPPTAPPEGADLVFTPSPPPRPVPLPHAGPSCCGTPHDHQPHVALCYPATLTPEEWADAIARWGGLPPGVFLPAEGERFFVELRAWWNRGQLVPSGLALPAYLTFSFPSDGVSWGGDPFFPGPNALRERIVTIWGEDNADLGYEWIRQGFAAWRPYAGLQFEEIPDDNAPYNVTGPSKESRGDIRIGAVEYGEPFLGYNALPSGGGDMVLNARHFTTGLFANGDNSFRLLRNTISHELGHAFGMLHTVPCDGSKLLEPLLTLTQDGPGIDDIRGVQRNNGDRLAGNHSAAAAVSLGDLAAPGAGVVALPWLSTNGRDGPNGVNQDWFRFTLSEPRTVAVTLTPGGGTYANARQLSGCEPLTAPMIDAARAGDLLLELRSADGLTVLATSPAGPGSPEQVSQPLAAGTYTIRVVDLGPNPVDRQFVQLYDLRVSAGAGSASPIAIAGVHKRVRADVNCYFIGDVNSRPVEPGAVLTPESFDWDLDGDGVFETTDNPRPIRRYVSNGEITATLRVTDSLGASATDTIRVQVHGATTRAQFVLPSVAARNTVTPVVIVGSNFLGVTSASQITVSGDGVRVAGTPVVNTLGTEIRGLSFEVASTASEGQRALTINTEGRLTTVPNLFRVSVLSPCPGDINLDRRVGAEDLMIVMGQFGQTAEPGVLPGDVDRDGRVGFQDLNVILASFGASC